MTDQTPNSKPAEFAIVAALTKWKEIYSDVLSLVTPDDFFFETSKTIFQSIISLHDEEKTISPIHIIQRLKDSGKLDKAGGEANVLAIFNTINSCDEVLEYATLVKEKSEKRRLLKIFQSALETGKNGEVSAEDLLERTEQALYAYTEKRSCTSFSSAKNTMQETIAEISNMLNDDGKDRIQTGFEDVDRLIYGVSPSDFAIIAARPAMGKTAFVLNLASYAALTMKKSVAFFSLEMNKKQLGLRLICAGSGVPSEKIKNKEITGDDFDAITNEANRISLANLYIDDNPHISPMEILSKCRRLKEERGLDLVIIDYLQLMEGSRKNYGENRQQEISDISRGLKILARELNVAVVALSQLNRSVEGRMNKRPLLSDLRESGSLEQDADMILFLYRDEYYHPDTEKKGQCEVIVSKNRNGEIGTATLFFDAPVTRFYPFAKQTRARSIEED